MQFPIAGIGSRFVALLLDQLIIAGAFVALLLLFLAVAAAGAWHQWMESMPGKWFFAALIFVSFLLLWCYFAFFEAFWHGQTPGKRVMKLRVIKDAGRQITLFESLARNLLRVVDYMPGMYLVGVITMLSNKRNKRLGDFVAGTIVVHERSDAQPLLYTGIAPRLSLAATPVLDPWRSAPGTQAIFPADTIARLSSHDLVIIETFFSRALDLPLEVRAAMAYRIAGEMTTKMAVPLPEGNPERALEAIATALRRQARRF